MSTFVIAEAGSCHDGDYGKAEQLVQAAAHAGADACKFQYWSSARRLADRRNALDYFEVYSKYQLPEHWLENLKIECEVWGIEFMTTCYLPEDIATIAPFVKRFKVASFEASDVSFILAHDQFASKEVIISTGMMTAEQADRLPGSFNYRWLHCVSAYPTPLAQANLAALRTQETFNPSYDGYSDHTHNVLTGALAVAAGARILEVHFRLDNTDTANPDYATALSPGQLKDYIALVRQAEVMMGSGVKEPQPAEADMMRYRVRK